MARIKINPVLQLNSTEDNLWILVFIYLFITQLSVRKEGTGNPAVL